MKSFTKGLVAVCFGIAAGGYAAAASGECCSDPLNADPSELTYRTLRSAGIVIPTYNQQLLEDGRIQFEIHRNDFSAFRYLMSRTMGLYGNGKRPDSNQPCPYINVPDRYFDKQYLDNGVIRVTMQMNPAILDVVNRQGCVITDTPAP